MPMIPCNNYTDMCKTGSQVKQCNTPILNFPAANDLKTINTQMCRSMPGMTGCSCNDCSIFKKYALLCKEMGGLGTGCDFWNQLCTQIPDWSICSDSDGVIVPMMQMYFHWSIYDYILFKTWVPYNALTYAISLIAVFLMALIHEGFKVAKTNLEFRWRMKPKYQPVNSSYGSTKIQDKSHSSIVYAPFDLPKDLLRALYRTIDVALHFFIMLVTMTFNAGLFIAVVLGYGVGHLLFARLAKPQLPGALIENEIEENCH